MGRQINFWMTAGDEEAFLGRLAEDDVVWSPYSLELYARPTIHELEDWQPSNEKQWRVLIRRCQWELLEVEDIAEDPLPQFKDGKFSPWTMVGTGVSPAFEWNTCERGAGFIRRGRIYFMPDWWEEEGSRKKDPEAGKWFNRLAGWLRRRGRKYKSSSMYLMPEAAAKADSGEIEVV